jgi:hypothetical protein
VEDLDFDQAIQHPPDDRPVGAEISCRQVSQDCFRMHSPANAPLGYFTKGPIKKEYAIPAGFISKSSSDLAPWVARNIAYATRRPPADGLRYRSGSTSSQAGERLDIGMTPLRHWLSTCCQWKKKA